MKNLKDKKGFTIIELIVVIAILGILVLLAGPRLLGYVEKAELRRIQHDVKVMENKMAEVLTTDDEFNKWENNSKDFNQLIKENRLFEKEGIAEKVEPTDEPYKVIPEKYKDKINTKLKGTFYANSGGKVYYEHDKPLIGIPTVPGDTKEEQGYSDEEIDELIEKLGYIPIATAEELNNVRNETIETYGKGTKWEREYLGGLDKKYIQVANVDLSGYSEEEDWAPIGNVISNFTGSFDGNGYKITGLTIDRSGTNFIGLFGYTSGATIENVALEDVNIKGKDSTGGLVGYAYSSTITKSYATGSVSGKDLTGGLVGVANNSTITNSYATGEVTGDSKVGGLVGEVYNSTITNSYATGEVTGTGNNTGGLVGYAVSSTITKSYATGSVTGTNNTGGLVGYANGLTKITNSYATGKVTGTSDTGGLVGWTSGSTITNSYATGSVTGSVSGEGYYYTGGLVGYANGSTITNSYWDTETTGQSTSAGGDGKTTEEMMKKATYSNSDSDWDFDEVWKIDEGKSYPTLRNIAN